MPGPPDIDLSSLLGRPPIATDASAVAPSFVGKRVLVTGAGGSIGTELCRQIARFRPSDVIMLDHDESALHEAQLSIYGRASLDDDSTVLADIREPRTLAEVFGRRRPHIVFHAAALKHLPILEKAPGEAVKTNVWGTLNVLQAARAVGVELLVNISSDKAANPISVLGYSKRIAEGLTAAVGLAAPGTFLSVRFGNVLGSRGSVVAAFAAQIAGGNPLTVTDPETTRHFMTIREAVELVVQAGDLGYPGDVLVLDMGEPVPIVALAERMIALSASRTSIVYTGLRDGEKLHEDVLGRGEENVRTTHPLITRTKVPPTSVVGVRALDPWSERNALTADLVELCAAMEAQLHIQGRREATSGLMRRRQSRDGS